MRQLRTPPLTLYYRLPFTVWEVIPAAYNKWVTETECNDYLCDKHNKPIWQM